MNTLFHWTEIKEITIKSGEFTIWHRTKFKSLLETPDMYDVIRFVMDADRDTVRDHYGLCWLPDDREDIGYIAHNGQALLDLVDSTRMW